MYGYKHEVHVLLQLLNKNSNAYLYGHQQIIKGSSREYIDHPIIKHESVESIYFGEHLGNDSLNFQWPTEKII